MSLTLVDPLSEVSRKERRMLLGLSMLGIFLTHGGALPTQFTALGVQLNADGQATLLLLFALGLAYFLSAFFIYAISDFIVWRKKITMESIEHATETIDNFRANSNPQNQYDALLEHETEEAWRKYRTWSKLTKPTSFLRATFEFVLPIVVGFYSMAIVFIYAFTRT